jgi:hypothetical protein
VENIALIVTTAIALVGWLLTGLTLWLNSMTNSRNWLRERRDTAYLNLMDVLEGCNLLYVDGSAAGPWEEAPERLKELSGAVRLYGSARVSELLCQLEMDLRYVSIPIHRHSDDQVDDEADEELMIEFDRAGKRAYATALDLNIQLQRETRRRLARVTRRPIGGKEFKAPAEAFRKAMPPPTRLSLVQASDHRP